VVETKAEYTVRSSKDGWVVEVYGQVPKVVAQYIADSLGAGVDYIDELIVFDLVRRSVRARGWRSDGLAQPKTRSWIEFRNIIHRALVEHNVECQLQSGRLMALEPLAHSVGVWHDATEWGPREVLGFLGY